MSEDNISATSTNQESSQDAHTGHPTPMTYFKVAMALSVITAIEVAIFYVEDLGHGIIPILVILSAGKFALVAMFYMHLKYDAKLFSGFFIGGLILATTVGIALLGLFKFFA
jgi:cytochrome c oxidase subunit 4